MNKYKEELLRAERYDDIMKILNTITRFKDDSDASYPVHLFRDHSTGRIRGRVSGISLKVQAHLLINIIDGDDIVHVNHSDIGDLLEYVTTKSEQFLHNFAVELSHGKIPENGILNEIRIWQILQFLIYDVSGWNTDLDEENWEIPHGWILRGNVVIPIEKSKRGN